MKKEVTDYLLDAENNYKKNVNYRRRADYASARKNFPIDQQMIIYNSFYGRGMLDNPYALFKYIQSNDEFANYRHIWVLDNLNNHKVEIELYKNNENVIFVEQNSKGHILYLAVAKYVINNSTEMPFFVKREGQIVINTWHGIPLKTLGYDIPGNGATIGGTMRNFLMSDYLLAADEFMTNQMYSLSYKLKDLYEGTIVEAGYPRFDTIVETNKEEFIEYVSKFGVQIDRNKKVVLYAPTWKGKDFNNPDIDIENDLQFIENLYGYLDRNEYQILFKPHQTVYNAMIKSGMTTENIIPAVIDANEILSITDILISDYSSIFFDYLLTGNPLLFYIPDIEEYSEERGTYFGIEFLPGPTAKTQEELGELLKEIGENKENYKKQFDYQKYLNVKEKFIGDCKGDCCKKIVDAIWKQDITNIKKINSNKYRILIHVDVLKENGITNAAMNFMENIDYNKYDVTLHAIPPKDRDDVLEKINRNVRVLRRVGTVTATMDEWAMDEFCKANSIIGIDGNVLFPHDMYNLEYKRCFGQSKFDCVINFSGYNGYFSNILCTEKSALQLMWLHNDMLSELDNRIIDGVHIFEKNLPQVFKHYNNVDKIVGCSKATMQINREKLGTESTYDRFTYMHNLLDIDRINKLLKDDSRIVNVDNKEYWFNGENVEELVSGKEVELIPLPDEKNINYINVARLSPEKNQENLIRAFAKVYKKVKRARLYILGEGPLKNHLLDVVKELNLVGKVIITGNVDNPFIFEKKSQCFVLPSYHEGFPMVLLEARTIGLPIIVSNFSTVEDCLFKDGQYLTEMGENDIYIALEAFIEGKVPNNYAFDAYEYNKMCMNEFDKIIEDSLEKKNEDKNL